MRVALYHGAGRLTLEERPDPVAGPGELVVRVRACGLCGSDLMQWYQDPRAPVVLGHEPAGEVVEAGPGAPFALGDRVFVHHHVPCMTCALCRAGRHTLCDTFRRTRIDPGGLAELIRVPAENARLDTLALPLEVSDSDATLIEPLGCVLRGQRFAGVAPGSRVAVVGAGAMGLLEIGAALAAGAERVVAIEPREDRRALALAAGAVAAFADDDPGAIRDALGGLADQVFVCTTKAEAIAGALHLAGPAGVVQLFAPPRPGTPVPLDLGAIFFREVTIQFDLLRRAARHARRPRPAGRGRDPDAGPHLAPPAPGRGRGGLPAGPLRGGDQGGRPPLIRAARAPLRDAAFRDNRHRATPDGGPRRRASQGGRRMASRRRTTVALAISVAAVGALVVGAVAAVTRSSDETALQPTRKAASRGVEHRIDSLLAKMTTTEKLQQLQLLSDGQITDADARAGVGSVFSLTDPAKIDHFQQIAVKESRLHIPILFAYDTIHGYRTIFPIPLGAASSFDPGVATADGTISARETATVGIKQIYSPMVDVSHEPRWGRISEGAGEDPYLGSVFAAARVKAGQGADYSKPDKVVTSVKHYAAYGQPEGGREYGTTDMSVARLRNLYLPPFKAAIDAGSDTVMCSFNAINGVPGCANSELETDLLKKEWGFDGFIESDYTAVAELRACPPVTPDEGPCGHGVAADGPGAAAAALNAGTDSEMVSTNIRDYGKQLLSQKRISMSRVNDAVRRILRVKFRAGLFEHPYVDQAKAVDPASFVTPADRTAARTAAAKSMVLLKNDGGALPLDPAKSVAVIGPLGDSPHDMLGPWWGKGSGHGRRVALRRHQGAEPQHHVHGGLHDRGQGPARQHARG